MKATLTLSLCVFVLLLPRNASAELKVGAAVIDVTPIHLPVLVNGGITSRREGKVKTKLHARAIAVDDGDERLAIVVVDSCMLPRPLLDEAKRLAAKRTKIRPDRMLISATHTHSAPSAISCLGTDADPTYVPYLREKLVEAIAAAEANLEPAQVGWAVSEAAEFTALRRWIRRPDRIAEDPFGNPSVRANMHAGSNWDDVTGESGPEDPDLSLISFQAKSGRPIAVLANFSMHYFSGEEGLSADYFGLFAGGLEDRLGRTPNAGRPPFVGIMSHGCSGDIWRRDYTLPSRQEHQTIEAYTRDLLEIAFAAYDTIAYDADADVAMAEARLELKYRVPDKQRLEWARRIVATMGDREPKTTVEAYARDQITLDELQRTEVVVQALRIGEIAIATTPTETYALTGLKLKLQSPLPKTMVIELANGGDGYIPPPEQHFLGGYNTWPARSAGLEIQAEPKITEAALGLLERVGERPRRAFTQERGRAANALLNAEPAAYWRLDELSGPRALDSSGGQHAAIYEPGVVFFLGGPRSSAFCSPAEKNRAAHFAGGRLDSRVAGIGDRYSVSLWIWNGMPVAARETTGWVFSRSRDHGLGLEGDHVGVGGTATAPGKLIFVHDGQSGETAVGRTPIKRWTWHHVIFIRDGPLVRIYLDGDPQPEIDVSTPVEQPLVDRFFFGGRCDNESNWEGRLDEIALFDRALTEEEAQQFAASSTEETRDALSSIEGTQGGRHWVDKKPEPPKSPEQSRRCFEIEPGLEIQLFAAEPLVMDPVSIAFDRHGRMFVVEYADYPEGAPEGEPPLSRLVLVEDVDGDGRADLRHLFADGLTFAHSLMAMKDGIVVGAQSEILFLKDTDGDNRADVREVLFGGFKPAHPQMQIGNPRWGFDNWIYFNYGPGEITAADGSRLKMPRTEFRFHPLTMEYGPASGLGQFGNTIDNWGRRFFTTHRNPLMTSALSWSEAQRNPFLIVPKLHYDVGPAGGDALVYPLVETKSNYLSHAGSHTSSCGTTAYRGDLFGAEFENSVFVSEPIGHLVARSVITTDGVRLVAQRARPKADFLASTDMWFRPANLATGPDGALYLADMYRLWVEHPKFLPEEVAKRLDWRAGEDRGRIWRIAPENASPRRFEPPTTTADLVALLSDSNGWRRQLGQRLLVERQAKDAAPALAALLTKGDNAYARLHALWTLDGLAQLSVEHISRAFKDTNEHVRKAAITLAAPRISGDLPLFQELVRLAKDDNIGVRFQVALALGNTDHPLATRALAMLARHDGSEKGFALAILTSARERCGAILTDMAKDVPKGGDDQRMNLVRELATVIGARGNEGELVGVFRTIAETDKRHTRWRTAVLNGLARGLPRHRGQLGETSLPKLLAAPPKALAESAEEVRGVLSRTQAIALDSQQETAARVAAIELLGLQPFDQTVTAYEGLLAADQAIEIDLACIEALEKNGGDRVAPILLKKWPRLRPKARGRALGVLLSRTDTTRQALEAMSAGTISPAVIGINSRVRLLRHRDNSIRELATRLLGGAISANRRQVAQEYRAALTMKASAKAGKETFGRTCAKCHQIDDQGHEVGPDISDLRNRSREALLHDILDPNRKVEPRFTGYLIVTKEGRIFSGLLVAETTDAVIVRQAEGKEEVIPRAQIAELRASEISLMPEGVEKEVSVQQMADLLEFLKSPRQSRKPGG